MRILVLVMVLLAAAACAGGDSGSPDQWAVTAEQWRAAWYEAGAEGRANVLNFLSEDVVIEDRIAGHEIRGWDDYLDQGRSLVGDIASSQPLAMFLAADGFLDQYYWSRPYTVEMLDRVEMDGAVATRFVDAGSISSGRYYLPEREGFDAFERLADGWVALWNGEGDIADVYASGARIEDSLLGLSAAGLDGIAEVVGTEAGLDLPPMHIPDLPQNPDGEPGATPVGARAIHVGHSDVDPSRPDVVHIVLEGEEESGCPGLMAVSLEVADGLVLSEERYHEVSSVRRCRDVATLEPGWWEDIEVPEPVRLAVTEPMVWPERAITVEIHNGSPEVTEYVRWGLEQFDAVGMQLPDIGSVTFLVKESTCSGYLGFYGPRPGAADITLCRTLEQVCGDDDCQAWPVIDRHTLLHEYAHAWMSQYLDQDTRDAFLEFAGVANWNDPADDWEDRGVERAAHTIAFGLLGEPTFGSDGHFATCEKSIEGFRVLTGTEPLTSCPQQPHLAGADLSLEATRSPVRDTGVASPAGFVSSQVCARRQLTRRRG